MVENLKIAETNPPTGEKEVQAQDDIAPPRDPSQLGEPTLKHFKQRILKAMYFHFYRLHAILFLFSVCVSALSQVFGTYLPVVQEFAAGFLIFWMPGFCIMFLLWDSTAFKPIYLLPLTLAFSQVIIISEGAINALLGFLWTPVAVLCINSGFVCATFYVAWRFKRFRLGQPLLLKHCETLEQFCKRFQAGKIIPKNFGYLFGFIILLGIYAVIAFPLLPGDDPWFHALLVRIILETGYIPFDLFRGAAGLHIYSSAFGLLAGWSVLLIARWFPVFLILNGNLAFYLLISRLLKNPQIANLGTFLISFTPLQYFYGVNNFWANAIALPFGLYLLFFLFDANLRKKPSSRSQRWTYIIIGLYFSFILRMMHPEIYTSYWLSALFFQIFYCKTKRAQLGNLILIFLTYGMKILYDLRYMPIDIINPAILSTISPIILVFIIPVTILGFMAVKKLADFPPGNLETFTAGKATDGKIFYLCEKRYVKFVILGIFVIAFPIALYAFSYITEIIWFITTVGVIIVFILQLFSILLGACIIRRQERWGKVIFFWSLFFMIGIIGYWVYDMLYTPDDLTLRLIVFSSPALMLAGMAYIKYALNTKNLTPKKTRRFLGIFVLASVTICIPYLPIGTQYMNYASISAAKFLSLGLPDKSVIVTSFTWDHSLNYCAYPKWYNITDEFGNYLIPIDGNLDWTFFYNLQKEYPGTEIYIILDSSYLHRPIVSISQGAFGVLDLDDLSCYDNSPHLNSIQGYWIEDGNWMLTFCLV
ncbi:MAG: hypothetical protein RBG13Loki_3306 [Promethearchaeota archaeon CR_4]|nr:MAG: hypothetical protein RBG13Loki_3306 [Candidatus Lokiarchaeota archaeon CR_4]